MTVLGAVLAVFVLLGAVGSGLGASTESDSGSSAFDPAQDDEPLPADDSTEDEELALEDELEEPLEEEEPPPNPQEGVVTIIVRSTGSSGGSVTYVRPDSGNFQMSQDTAARLPWRKSFRNVQDLPMGWNMNAQQDGDGTLTCIIKKDGEVIARNSSQGSYAVVTCQP